MNRSILAVVLVGVFGGLAAHSPGQVFMADNLVYQNSFEGDPCNTATGAASAGSDGDVTMLNWDPTTPWFYITSQPGGGQAANSGTQGYLTWPDAAGVGVAGATGFTASLFVKVPQGYVPNPPAAGWLWNAIVSGSNAGMRIQSNGLDFRCTSPPGFFGSAGVIQTEWQHVAYTVYKDPNGLQPFHAHFYVDGQPAESSGAWASVSNDITNAVLGATTPGAWEFRLQDIAIDELRLYNVGMSAEEVTILALDRLDGPLHQCSSSLVADVTGDCEVNLADLSVLAGQWLYCGRVLDPECEFYGVP